jgi:hypothetical protein
MERMMNAFTLSEPTVFPDFNKKSGRDAAYAVTELQLHSLKYKHFREIAKFPEEDQMHRLMLSMTGLTEEDIGELTPNDAAGISQIIFESMKKYFELGQKIIRGMEKE